MADFGEQKKFSTLWKGADGLGVDSLNSMLICELRLTVNAEPMA